MGRTVTAADHLSSKARSGRGLPAPRTCTEPAPELWHGNRAEGPSTPCQQMRSSCLPMSMSTIRLAPTSVRAVTGPAGPSVSKATAQAWRLAGVGAHGAEHGASGSGRDEGDEAAFVGHVGSRPSRSQAALTRPPRVGSRGPAHRVRRC